MENNRNLSLRKRSFVLSPVSSYDNVQASSSELDVNSFAARHLRPIASTASQLGVTSVEILLTNRAGDYVTPTIPNPLDLTSSLDVPIIALISIWTGWEIESPSLYSTDVKAFFIATVYMPNGDIIPGVRPMPPYYLSRRELMTMAWEFKGLRRDIKEGRALWVADPTPSGPYTIMKSPRSPSSSIARYSSHGGVVSRTPSPGDDSISRSATDVECSPVMPPTRSPSLDRAVPRLRSPLMLPSIHDFDLSGGFGEYYEPKVRRMVAGGSGRPPSSRPAQSPAGSPHGSPLGGVAAPINCLFP